MLQQQGTKVTTVMQYIGNTHCRERHVNGTYIASQADCLVKTAFFALT